MSELGISLDDVNLFKAYAGKEYRKDVEDDKKISDQLNKKFIPFFNRWGKSLVEQYFPGGTFLFDPKSTNPVRYGGLFKNYYWLQIFPMPANENLVFTLSFYPETGFEVRIDTYKCGTDEAPVSDKKKKEIRENYQAIRDTENSNIASALSIEEGLAMSMEKLVEWTISEFKKFTPTYEDICKKLGLEMVKNGQSDRRDTSSVNKLNHPPNQILFGPAGTGKTYNTINYALSILDGRDPEKQQTQDDRNKFKKYMDERRIQFVTFHQSYGYEEFVEGIRVETIQEDPENNSSKKILNYDVKAGIFKNICDDARNNKDSNYVLIIDEINRGNISKIFGELITLIEDSKREGNNEALPVTLPYSGKSFSVPGNLYIIGTMNSSDRSLTSLDLALRRRFEFIEMLPDPTVLKDITINYISVQILLETINKRIKALLDQDHCIGHANFTHLTSNSTVQDLMTVFEKKIIPLLQEYFFNDWEKINLVLGGNSMIIKDEIEKDLFLGMVDENQIQRLNSRSWKINTDLFDKDARQSYKAEALRKIIGKSKNITAEQNTEDQETVQ